MRDCKRLTIKRLHVNMTPSLQEFMFKTRWEKNSEEGIRAKT